MSRKICVCILLLLIVPYTSCGLRERTIKQYDDNKTWKEAQSFCREQHYDLITIRNYQQSQELNGKEGWIGLYQENNRSPWKWSSGEELGTFSYWISGNRDLNQNCSYIRSSSPRWEDDECHVKRKYICYNEALVLVNENQTWEQALEHCRSLKKEQSFDLATLDTLYDLDYARERAQPATTDEVWTGLRFLGDEWFWVSGDSVKNRTLPSCPAVRCGVLEKNKNTYFGIRDCSEKRNFFCSKKT